MRVVATPLNVTDLAPVNATPVMTTFEPTGPVCGEKPVIDGGTLKLVVLDADPPGVVTLILPLAPQHGTIAVICEYELTTKLVVDTLLNVTAVAPVKAFPAITTDVPTGPLVGEKLRTVGWTRNLAELVAVPEFFELSVIGPVYAPSGDVVVICVSVVTANVAVTSEDSPVNMTEVVPRNPVPVRTTDVPT